MIFKNFFVDYDKITIDDQVIPRPIYLSVSQWMDFWEFSDEANSGHSVSDRIMEEVDEHIRSVEDKHAEEIVEETEKLKEEFNNRLEDIKYLLDDKMDELGKLEDHILKMKFKVDL